MQIRRFEDRDLAAVLELSLRAWAPVFVSIEQSLQAEVYQHFFPDWRHDQAASVESVCKAKESHVWVAEIDGEVAGFVAVQCRTPTFAEIYMIAVDPRFQRQGIADALTDHSLQWMREQGIVVAMVETGEDPGHAPARKLYESKGFRLSPVARYFQYLR